MANAIPAALAMDNTAFRPVDILRSMIGGDCRAPDQAVLGRGLRGHMFKPVEQTPGGLLFSSAAIRTGAFRVP